MKMEIIKKAKAQWKRIGTAVKIVTGTAPFASFYVLLYAMLNSFSGSITGLLIEGITNEVLQKNLKFTRYVLVYVLFFVLLQMISFGYAVAMNTCVYEKVTNEADRRLAHALTSVSYYDMENQEKMDGIFRARQCVEYEQISDCFMQIIRLGGTILAIGSAALVLGSWNPMLPLLLFLLHIPETRIRKQAVKAENEVKNKNSTLEREKEDLWKTFYRKEAAKEIRTFGIGEQLMNNWRRKNEYLYLQEWKIKKKGSDMLLGAQILKIIGLVGGLVILGVQCYRGEILAGTIVGAFTLMPSFQESFTEFGEYRSRLQKNLFYLDSYYSVVKESTQSPGQILTVKDQITAEHLHFSYDTGKEILRDVSFSIQSGEKVAIVGENGAGKSTLVKCLLGLYPLKQGSISYDGVPLDSEKKNDYRNISLMEHEFGRYRMTVAENIGFEFAGDVDLDSIGLQNVFLGKEEGGVELSGGQWQKIALARCLQKEAQMYILDEPTSALDPIHERKAMEKLLKRLDKKTVLLITHRIGICRQVDKILVMGADHTLAGVGTHNQLMKECGVYRKLYENQAKWYE